MLTFVLLFLSYSSSITGQTVLNIKEEKTIIINSAPEGAEVFIDGELKGLTPLKLTNFNKAKFNLSIRHKDFKTIEQTIRNSDSKTELFYILDGEYGLVNVNSEPSGAKVKINNQEFGTTPLSSIKLPLGINKFEFKKENYELLSKTVYVSRTKQNVISKLKYLYAFLTINKVGGESTCDEISFDGKKVPDAENKELRFDYGWHNITIDAPDFHRTMQANYLLESGLKYKLYYKYNMFTLKYVCYSILVPGLGQFLDNSKIKGVLWCAATITNAILLITTDKSYQNKKDEYYKNLLKYNTSVKERDLLAFRAIVLNNEKDANDLRKKRNLFVATLAGLYALNLLDVVLFHTKDYELSIMPQNNDTAALIDIVQFKLKL